MDRPEIIESTAFISFVDNGKYEYRINFDLEDIRQKRDACAERSIYYPEKIIIRFKRGDRVFGIPIEYAMEE